MDRLEQPTGEACSISGCGNPATQWRPMIGMVARTEEFAIEAGVEWMPVCEEHAREMNGESGSGLPNDA